MYNIYKVRRTRIITGIFVRACDCVVLRKEETKALTMKD